ncbi:phospholipase D family protein [Vibrio sp. THAF190c]|uniref:phospholipase D family protein n=1 Tax=Vibrio sp. THAF190c TaxID=2587865 RepID=UPI001267AD9C|nr:phospholipase D family protein [Vibrio sp. THAF190c]QFT11654.1 NgoFVII restriction endonuclease [Vibrio sp. THAF190c]|tara:strand:+ start:1528 stop:2001 length:474 start_codon:yes stop_codon:yes gene_type:complete
MFLSNNSSTSHLNEISRLIELSEECILCTCWLDLEALDLIESFVEKRKSASKVQIYSDGRKMHVSEAVRMRLKSNPDIEHFYAKRGKRLHSKIYYFSTGDSYSAIIGSANLTGRGLSRNDEFSAVISGNKSSNEHQELIDYLTKIKSSLKSNSPKVV